MSAYLNPYDPPPVPATPPLLWDRAVLAQAAVAFQMTILAVCLFAESHSEHSASSSVLDDSGFRLVIAVGTVLGFIIVLAATLTKRDWPIGHRFVFSALDLILVVLIAAVADGFGTM